MATVQELCEAALQKIGVLAASETASSGDATLAFTELNRYTTRLRNQGLTVHQIVRTTWTISANDGEYTVGSGANIDVTRPVAMKEILSVWYINTSDNPDTEYPLRRLTRDGYAAVSQKARTDTYPSQWFYNPTMSTGTMYLFPIPTATTLTGVMYSPTPIAEFSALSSTVTLSAGYEDMLTNNLAVQLCPAFERQPSPVLIEAARESLAGIKRMNITDTDMAMEAAALIGHRSGASYDILKG